ncbi:MAG: sulfur carrier protein ThiS [Alistipes sp.]|nr:sulfur carrier protein ThiS [Alistipes sp.]
MDILLNGAPVATEATNLAELIAAQAIPTSGLAVALGTQVIRRSDWEQTPLTEGAQITLIRATQGG